MRLGGLLVVRTRQPFLSSRPANALLWLTLTGLLATILLPVSPLASEMGFTEIFLKETAWIAGILVLYVVTAAMLKVRFFQAGTRAGQR
ncbi:hypothetical protein GCM10010967_48010 [Dyadobacter beijingensis]|uniref:Uncharacterized protein n=1 Tax=Dyadobacter beijingensis TaxID=365489 RepID=A0ABQ2IGF0_9BACT|nr:hypothetical protein [Dyadobacter beijingensis]GGN07010.1 hypothetical protein GCM10010967_48010 [Dyadobacter beijingensis]